MDSYPEGTIEVVKLENGHQLIKQRSFINAVSIIKSGIAKCYLYQGDGTDFILEFFGEGEVVGEIEMLNNELSFAGVEALTPMTILQLPRDRFNQLLVSDKDFNHHILKLLASKVRYKATRFSFNQTHTIEQTLSKLFKEVPNLFDVISKKDLSSYLGITERSLNRALKGLTPA